MKRTVILLFLVWFFTALQAQYFTPWGISSLSGSPNTQESATQITALSLGGIVSTGDHSDYIYPGLQQTGLDHYISTWDTLDIEDLLEFSVYDSSTIGYILISETLGPLARFEIHPDQNTMGTYSWDASRQLFTFVPDLEMMEFSDTIIFMAIQGADTISRHIHFTYIPQIPPESNLMGLLQDGYQDDGLLNDVVSVFDPATSTLHIAGRILLFDRDLDDHGICEYSAQGDADSRFENIRSVMLYADSILIHEPLHFPGCDLTIYARKLVFDGVTGTVNTTPFSNILVNQGQVASDQGEDAGDIHLYTGDLLMGPGSHFILRGGNGQSVTKEAGINAGNGGDGGTLFSPVYIAPVACSLEPGSPGQNGTDNSWGVKGQIVKTEWDPAVWVHPRNIQPVMDHLRHQYMENNLSYVRKQCASLNALLDSKFGDSFTATNVDEADLMNAWNEIQELQNRINRQLDYFGNPIGWVPLLSFEVYQSAFEKEVDHAFNLMFLSYLINTSDANIVRAKDGMEQARGIMKEEVGSLQEDLNENIGKLEGYEITYEKLEAKVQSLNEELGTLEARLLKDAEQNAEKEKKLSVFKSIAKIGSSILSAIPFPGCQVAGQALGVVSEMNLEKPFSLENASLLAEASANAYSSYKDYKKKSIDKFGTDAKMKELTGISDAELEDIDSGLDKWNTMNEAASGMISFAAKYDNSTSMLAVSDEMVQAELEKLKAASTEYINLMSRIETTVNEKRQMHDRILQTINGINRDLNRISENRMAIQSLTSSIQSETAKRDIRTMQYANRIEKRAFERLQKYHYLMSRAFEYRTLMPWTDPLDLESVRNGLFEYVINLSDTLSSVTMPPKAEFDAMKSVYYDQVRDVANKTLENFENGGLSTNGMATLELSREELDLLNNGEKFFINPYERNEFGLGREDIRIVDIGVTKCILEDGTEVLGSLTNSAQKSASSSSIDIHLEHSGYSKLQSKGKIYYFNNYRTESGKFKWTSTIDLVDNTIFQEETSKASLSLLNSLVGDEYMEKGLYCSQPSAWADISLEKKAEGESRKIVSMDIKISYDYISLSKDYSRLMVETEGDLSPYYIIGKEDINGLKDGKGSFYRTFNKDDAVNVKAPLRYGNQVFIRWDEMTQETGKREIFSPRSLATIANDDHTHLIAVYEKTDSVWVITPNENQAFSPGGTLGITWDQNVDHDVKIDLYSDGFFVTSICDSLMGKSFVWNIPQDFSLPENSNGHFNVKICSRLDYTLYGWSKDLLFLNTSIRGDAYGRSAGKLHLYPNPAKDRIFMNIEGVPGLQEYKWLVYNMNGKLVRMGVLQFESEMGSAEISLEGLARGPYVINLKTEGRLYMERFIVE